MSYKTCCVSNCLSRVCDGIPLHQFPNYYSDQERFLAWITNIGGETSTLEHSYICNNRRVCHRHFEKRFHSKNRLVKVAIPTLHLSDPVRQQTKSIVFVDVNECQLQTPSPQTVSTCDQPSSPNSLLPGSQLQSEKPTSPTPSSLVDEKQPDTFEVEYLDEEILQLEDSPIPETPMASSALETHMGSPALETPTGSPALETPMGSPIHKDIASKWQDTLLYGLTEDVKENLMKEYRVPSNCDLLITPTLNPEVETVLQDTVVKRDSSLEYKQKQLSAALSALATATKLVISNETSKEKLLKTISDAGRILCDSHFMETDTRRNFVLSSMDTKLKDELLETKRGRLLFGENIAIKLKAANNILQSGDAKMDNK